MPELTLDHEQRDPLAGHLDRMGVPQLMRRERPTDTGREGGVDGAACGCAAGAHGRPRVGPRRMQNNRPTGRQLRNASEQRGRVRHTCTHQVDRSSKLRRRRCNRHIRDGAQRKHLSADVYGDRACHGLPFRLGPWDWGMSRQACTGQRPNAVPSETSTRSGAHPNQRSRPDGLPLSHVSRRS